MEDLNFIPVDREIKLDTNRVMTSKLTPDGVIDYINNYFTEISGYEAHELVGETVEIFKHREIPVSIFDLIIDGMKQKKNLHFILKNQAKDGRYYWFVTNFEYKTNANDEIISITCNRHAVPSRAIPKIDAFYKKLVKIEQNAGMEVATKYFKGFLEEKRMSFDEYSSTLLEEVTEHPSKTSTLNQTPVKKKRKEKSLFDKLFKK